jgi:hypothetical protein
MKLGKASGGQSLPSGTSIALFGAQAEHVHMHDELDATGGTLYYLSHSEVTEGSTQVTLVVKDRSSGNTLARVPQKLGLDYIVKEFEGRLMFTRPVSSVWDDGSLIGDARLMGNPVTIEVDYETPGKTQEKSAMGGRIAQAVGASSRSARRSWTTPPARVTTACVARTSLTRWRRARASSASSPAAAATPAVRSRARTAACSSRRRTMPTRTPAWRGRRRPTWTWARCSTAPAWPR